MIRGLYTSGWSMLANTKQMDVISNNLANVNTNAYKKDTVVFESFPSVLAKRINDSRSPANPSGKVGNMELGFDVGEIHTYYNQAQFQKTDGNLDFAINGTGNAFFSVQFTDANGNAKELYTRDGAFAVNANHQLVTKDGYPVIGQNGVIIVGQGEIAVDLDGTITQDGKVVDKLLIKEFSDTTQLKKLGSNLIDANGGQEKEFEGSVIQGYLEQSNVNIVKEMVDMISVMRAYEANQKVLQAQDDTLGKAVNELGSLR